MNRGHFKTGRARFLPSRDACNLGLSGSFALPDAGSETPARRNSYTNNQREQVSRIGNDVAELTHALRSFEVALFASRDATVAHSLGRQPSLCFTSLGPEGHPIIARQFTGG
jgi:hypothetical protein